MSRRALLVVLATTVIASFSAFALGIQAVRDIRQLRDDNAVWNAARPVIEDAAANLSVGSLATLLLLVLVAGAALWDHNTRQAHSTRHTARPRRAVPVTAALACSSVITGALLWWSGARRTGGAASLLDDIDASNALTIFEDYDRFAEGWQRQATGLAVVCAGAALALTSLLLWDRPSDQTSPAQDQPTEHT